MFKKFISLILTAAMMSAVMCAVVSVSATAEEKVTYYFLAPDNYCNTEMGALNEYVGYYYWEPNENAAWPGEKATPAPEVGSNVFKIEIGNNDETGTVIFNAFVDPGYPADPEMAKFAHQTVNIDLEEDDYYGMIYVLYDDDEYKSVDEFSGAVTTSGGWFSINPNDDNYYRNYIDGFKPAPLPSLDKAHHKDDTVTLTYSIGNVPGLGAFGSEISYDTSVLELTEIKQVYTAADPDSAATIVLNPNPKQFAQGEGIWKVGDPIKIAGTGEPFGGTADFAGEPAAVAVYTFKALKDFDDNEMNFNVETNKLISIVNNKYNYLVNNTSDDDSAYVHLDYKIDCPHTEPIPKPEPSEYAHHKDDTVTLTYSIGNVPGFGSFDSEIYYDTSVLELTGIEKVYTAADTDSAARIVLNPNPKQFAQGEDVWWKVGDPIKIGGTGEPSGGTADFAGEPAPIVVCTFKALKDFDDNEMNFNVETIKLVNIVSNKTNCLVNNTSDDDSAYVHLDYEIDCPHAEPIPKPQPSEYAHHKDDTVTLTYSIGNVPGLGAFGSEISYDTSVLELTEIKQVYTAADPDSAATIVLNPNPKQFAQGKGAWKVGEPIKIAAMGEPFGGTADFAGEPAAVAVYTFKALKDFDDNEMKFNVETNKLVSVINNSYTYLVNNTSDDDSAYVHIDYVIECPHNVEPIPKPDPIETPDTKPEPDPEPVQNPHTFFFDTSDWNSTTVQFYIWDGEGHYATKDGWTDSNPWGSNKKLGGTLREDLSGKNGNTGNVFESYPVELESGKLYHVIFNDPDHGQTFDCCLRSEAYLDTAYRTGYMLENPEDAEKATDEAKFRRCGLGAQKCITQSGKIQGDYMPAEMDRPYEVAVFVLKYLYYFNPNTGEIIVTEKLLDEAYKAFGVTADKVWEVYKSFPTEPKYANLYDEYKYNYDEAYARQMIRPTMIGDLDGDYTITSADALFVLRYSVGLEKFDDRMLTVANVNNDESVDSLDSLLILRKSVGLSDQDAHFNDV